ncbi:hypothetical protein [Pedobacter sp. SYSU D00535]|uniref:hypothetical protein n=1 Tax=Pedobacter sp. SYSU D00535 TaxID=2810308 RepID=UPI001A976250|nr:hypothetical protein [Pedobacter sp. SYSU D00535]
MRQILFFLGRKRLPKKTWSFYYLSWEELEQSRSRIFLNWHASGHPKGMEVRELVLKINEMVPAAPQEIHHLQLNVSTEGVAASAPAITGQVKKAFMKIVNRMDDDAFDAFLQHLLLLEHHRNTTEGLWATDEPNKFRNSAQFEHLFQLKFISGSRAWVGDRTPHSESEENNEDWD